MVLPKSKNSVGLGNSLMNDRFGRGKGADRKKVSTAGQGGVVRTDGSGQSYVTNAAKEASWVKMRSVTEQGALDEFLSTAELAGTDFTAEKMNNVKIIHTDQRNPYLLGASEERGIRKKHAQNRNRLTVPRRPKWNEHTTPQELDTQEKASLLDWRRGLAELQENDDLLMTPFERNIEVWRQLWRVIERSDLVVQIVDARNPLLFRSADLESYVKEVDAAKKNLLLVNKADMMTEGQREIWADYFESKGINYKFFSAHLAKEIQEGQNAENDMEENTYRPDPNEDAPEKSLLENVQRMNLEELENEGEDSVEEEDDEDYSTEDEASSNNSEAREEASSDRIRILTVEELEDLFLENAPSDLAEGRKTTIGLVGYPNVGKSSTINALIGAKKVSVSSTPGKTKHFQTIHLSPRVILCDCPGLVFPNFATTKAELVCAGILPIDQLREFTGPAGLVALRIPQAFLEHVYGIKINTRPLEEGGTGLPTASELLRAYARARGFATTGQGQPDESRAARYVLKDYVAGKLLFCHPPPHDPEIDGAEFNAPLYDFAHLPAKRQAWLIAHSTFHSPDDGSSLNDTQNSPKGTIPEAAAAAASGSSLPLLPRESGPKATQLDASFFGAGSGHAGHLRMPFNHPYTEQGRKKALSGRKAKTMAALENGSSSGAVVDNGQGAVGGKKKLKKGARTKQRNKRAEAHGEYDDRSEGVFQGPGKRKV